MTVSDNTRKAKISGEFLKNLGKKTECIKKRWQKSF